MSVRKRAEIRKKAKAVSKKSPSPRKSLKEISLEAVQLPETILDSTHILVAYLDPQMNFIRVNQAYAEADKREPSFYPGKNHFDLFPNTENQAIFRNVVETGKPYYMHAKPFEYAEHLKRGVSYRDWSLIPTKDRTGVVTGLVLSLVKATEYHPGEKAIRESEEYFRDFFEGAAIGFHIFGPDRKIIDINDAELAMIGYTRDEIVGKKTWADLIMPEQLEQFEKHWEDITTKGEVRDLKYTLVHKDGHHIEGILSASARFDKDGNLINTRGSFLDITQRKLMQEAIVRLAKFPSENPNPILRISKDGIVLYRNKASIPLLEAWQAQEGRPLSGYWKELVVNVLYSGIPQQVETECDSQTFSLTFAPIMDSDYVNVYALDITEHKRAEERQKLATQILRLLNKAGEETDPIREILFLIKEFAGFDAAGIRLRKGEDFPYYETIGFSADFVELENHLCIYNQTGELLRDSQGNPVLACICGNVICGKPDSALPWITEGGSFWTNCTTELFALTSDEDRGIHTRNNCNKVGYESVALIPLRSYSEIVGLLQLNDKRKGMFTLEMIRFFEEIGASIGISIAQKQARELREVLIAELEAKNTELERFIYTISHDLKTPLISIKGFVHLLEEDAAEGDAKLMDGYLKRIDESADRMWQLLNGLLELSRSGHSLGHMEVVSMSDLAHEVVNSAAGEIARNKVRVEISPDMPPVYGDPARLREVLQNLLTNATKFMGDQRRPHVIIGAREDSGQIVYYVRDNGMGIVPSYHTKAFGLFEKLHPKIEGTGVGLAIVKQIIVLHGGRIWVESSGLGKGCTFCFTLPHGSKKG